MLSVVGPLVSYARSWYSETGAHPDGGEEFTTVDLSKNGKKVSLAELFSKQEIFRELAADPVMRARSSDSVASLENLLSNYGCSGIPDDLLFSFAFHHLKEDRVAVRIGLDWGTDCRSARLDPVQVGIYLPIPPELRNDLKSAARSGLLMQEMLPKHARSKTP